MPNLIVHDDNNEDRRGFLRGMAWAGGGGIRTIVGGVPSAKVATQTGSGGIGRIRVVAKRCSRHISGD